MAILVQRIISVQADIACMEYAEVRQRIVEMEFAILEKVVHLVQVIVVVVKVVAVEVADLIYHLEDA